MRLILGLDAPTAGTVTVGGRPYRSLRRPLHEVGSLLESAAIHPGRSARAHLLALARANGIGRRRVGAVLGITGLHSVAGQRAGKFSLGMTQRLGVAGARHAIELHELLTKKASLEEAFMKLTRDAVEYRPHEEIAP